MAVLLRLDSTCVFSEKCIPAKMATLTGAIGTRPEWLLDKSWAQSRPPESTQFFERFLAVGEFRSGGVLCGGEIFLRGVALIIFFADSGHAGRGKWLCVRSRHAAFGDVLLFYVGSLADWRCTCLLVYYSVKRKNPLRSAGGGGYR